MSAGGGNWEATGSTRPARSQEKTGAFRRQNKGRTLNSLTFEGRGCRWEMGKGKFSEAHSSMGPRYMIDVGKKNNYREEKQHFRWVL